MKTLIFFLLCCGVAQAETYNEMRERQLNEIKARHKKEAVQAAKPKPKAAAAKKHSPGYPGYFYKDRKGTMRWREVN